MVNATRSCAATLRPLLTRCLLLGLLGFALIRATALAAPSQSVFIPPGQEQQVVLPAFTALREKLERGSVVEVTYLGGSVTKGASTFPRIGVGPHGPYDYSDYDEQTNSWRALCFEQLRALYEQWPGQLVQNNSALGATGSEISNYRFARDIGRTDILICEFVINDTKLIDATASGEAADRSAYRTMLGVVELARSFNPDVAIVFVLSPIREYPTGQTQLHQTYRTSYETVLRFVNDRRIPYVDLIETFFYRPIPPLYDALRLFDGGHQAGNYRHPAPEGHALVAETVSRETHRLIQTHSTSFAAVDPLPADLRPFPVQPRVMWASQLDALSTTDNWEAEINQEDWTGHPLHSGHLALFAQTQTAVLTVPFEGSALSLWWAWDYVPNKLTGRVEISLDGSVLGVYALPSDQPGDKSLRRFMPLATGLDPLQPHELVLKVLPSPGPQYLALHGILLDD